MNKNCEKCGAKTAVVHITDMMDGMLLERDLCEQCAEIRSASDIPPLRWKCHCGKFIEWRFDISSCGHDGSAYILSGETEKEIAVCDCGIHFIAKFSVWRCEICNATSLFPPRLGGSKGFLRDYLYGPSHMTKIEIKGFKGKI